LQQTQQLADEWVRPQAERWQRERVMGLEAMHEAARLNLLGVQVPVALGGLGLPFSVKSGMAAILAEADFGFALSLINTKGVASTLANWLPPEVSQRWLGDLLAGQRMGCTCLTEPGAGSDFGAIQMQATRHGAGWRLQGEKTWIINAQVAEVMVVYAQTQPGSGAKGIAAFVVDAARPGFRRTDRGRTEAVASLGTGGFVLDGYEVPADELLHPPGMAFKRAMSSINMARTYVAAMATAMVAESLRIARAYGEQRHTFGRALQEHQGWRWVLAEAMVDVEAAQLLIEQACAAADAQAPMDALAARAKIFATRMAVRHIAALLHALGAAGLSAQYPLSRHLAGAQVATLVDGSTEMLLERVWASQVRSARPAKHATQQEKLN
jgi:alkylation response protein AidB-like acyl-CoA dehydrogenase